MTILGTILFILALIGAIAGLIWWLTADRKEKTGGITLFTISAVVAVIAFLLMTVVTVLAGNRGVLLRFGRVDGVLNEGFNLKLPFIDSVELMSVKTQLYESDATAASKDLQDVTVKIAVNYRIEPSQTGYIYKTVGIKYIDVIAHPAVQETVKEVTAQFNAEDMILRRSEVKDAIANSLTQKLADRNIIAESINITNFEFSKEFTQAIEAKVVAQQNVLQAQNKLEQVKVEAQQAKAKAEGEAQAAIAKANGQAQSIQIVTDAQASSNQKIANSLNKDVLQYIFYDRLGSDVKVVVIPAGSNIALGDITSAVK